MYKKFPAEQDLLLGGIFMFKNVGEFGDKKFVPSEFWGTEKLRAEYGLFFWGG